MAEEGQIPITKAIKAPQVLKEIQTDKIEVVHNSDEGATYIVDNLIESNGGFYRVIGEIKKVM